MKVIVVGAGEVGFHISDRLSKEGHQVTIVERDSNREKGIQDKVNALIIQGNGGSVQTLEKAGIREADLFIAVTDIDEVNLISCLIAKELRVPFKIARVKNPEFVRDSNVVTAKSLGIELLINPQMVVSDVISKMVTYTEASEAAEFADGEVIFLSFPVHSDSPIADRTLIELGEKKKEFGFLVPAITRNEQTIVPTGTDLIKSGDTISFVCKKEDVDKVHGLLGLKTKFAKRIFILGAGNIGQEVAKMFSDGKHTIKMIDHNREHCEGVSENLDDILVLCSQSTDIETLKSEGISSADAYIAVTNDDSANILGSLLAKRYGVKRAIALVNDPELVNLAPTLGVDACISPRLSTAGAILKYIRGDRVIGVAMLEQNDAEVIEFQISDKFKKLEVPFHSMNVPEGSIVGAIKRKSDVFIPSGNDTLEIDDRVIVFCLAEAITKTEKFFV